MEAFTPSPLTKSRPLGPNIQNIITLCMYVQPQGYEFSHVGLSVYVAKNWLFEVVPLEISL